MPIGMVDGFLNRFRKTWHWKLPMKFGDTGTIQVVIETIGYLTKRAITDANICKHPAE